MKRFHRADGDLIYIWNGFMVLLLPATIVGGDSSSFVMGELISGAICLLSII